MSKPLLIPPDTFTYIVKQKIYMKVKGYSHKTFQSELMLFDILERQ